MVRRVVGSILHGVDPLSYFSFQPVFRDWCNKGRGMCYSVCGMEHIKEPLLLIGKSSPCSGGSGFPLSLSEWSFTICPTPYNRKIKCVGCVVKKTFPSLHIYYHGYFSISVYSPNLLKVVAYQIASCRRSKVEVHPYFDRVFHKIWNVICNMCDKTCCQKYIAVIWFEPMFVH